MLFANTPEIISLENNSELIFVPSAYSATEADDLFVHLQKEIPWQQDYFRQGGRSIAAPRLQAWLGDEGANYAYSGLSFTPHPWTPTLQSIREKAESIAQHAFNSVLVNLYRDEKDSVGWHSDNEKELGPVPVIASVSLGASRRFKLQHKRKKHLRFEIHLQHGDILVMRGELQQHWQHQVPKETTPTPARINLTYRQILKSR